MAAKARFHAAVADLQRMAAIARAPTERAVPTSRGGSTWTHAMVARVATRCRDRLSP